jgi:hypothetical protein
MAKKIVTTTTIIDDLDGTPIEDGQAELIKFTFENTNYELDLSKGNAKTFREALEPYTKVATVIGTRRTSTRTSNSNKEHLAAAREWLNANGHTVSPRGRIAASLMDLYQASK